MDEYDQLFSDLQLENKSIRAKTRAETIIENVETEFKSSMGSEEHISRQKEREELKKKIQRYSSSLKKYKNVRNHRAVNANKQRNESRNKLKLKIEMCKMRLKEIDIEEK